MTNFLLFITKADFRAIFFFLPQFFGVKDVKSNNACLIPINRLPIPGHTLPLVEYKSDHR